MLRHSTADEQSALYISLARIFPEVISPTSVVIIVTLEPPSIGIDVIPREPEQAVMALAAPLLIAVGPALVNSLIAKEVLPYIIGYVLLQVTIYATAGIVFLPEVFPRYLIDILS